MSDYICKQCQQKIDPEKVIRPDRSTFHYTWKENKFAPCGPVEKRTQIDENSKPDS